MEIEEINAGKIKHDFPQMRNQRKKNQDKGRKSDGVEEKKTY